MACRSLRSRSASVAAQDVVRRADLDSLDKELGFAAHALDQQRRQRLFVVENEVADDGAVALAGTENVFELALLQRRDRRRGDHAAVGNDADPADMEALAQTVDHRQHLGANRPALAVDDDGQDHLLQVRPIVLRVAVSPQAFAARATKRQTGRVHEDQREIAEQIAAPLEQALLDQVLDAAWRQRAGGGRCRLLAEPGHRAVEMVQLQPGDPGDLVVGHPFVAAAVRAGHKQPVQDTGKNRALDRKLKAAVLEQLIEYRGNAEPFPDPPEQQRSANARAGDAPGLDVGQDDGTIAMPRQRGG
jgi:hypothetical protein